MSGSELPVSTQASLLGLNRSTLYYKKVKPSEEDLQIKLLIDKIYTSPAIRNTAIGAYAGT